MQQHGVVLDFSADPVGIHFPSSTTSVSNRHRKPLVFATISSDSQDADSDDVDMGDECTIPSFIDDGTVILPCCSDPVLMPIVAKYRELFRNCSGRTDVGKHHIPTTGNPVRVPPRRIPAQYREVEAQIKDMLDKGIIEESSCPCMDGSCSVSHKENRRSTNMCGLQGIKQTNGERCIPTSFG